MRLSDFGNTALAGQGPELSRLVVEFDLGMLTEALFKYLGNLGDLVISHLSAFRERKGPKPAFLTIETILPPLPK
jgi:hypothetical protein